MRRVAATAVVLVACAALVLFATGASGGGGKDKGTYWVQLDNAFGLNHRHPLGVGFAGV